MITTIKSKDQIRKAVAYFNVLITKYFAAGYDKGRLGSVGTADFRVENLLLGLR